MKPYTLSLCTLGFDIGQDAAQEGIRQTVKWASRMASHGGRAPGRRRRRAASGEPGSAGQRLRARLGEFRRLISARLVPGRGPGRSWKRASLSAGCAATAGTQRGPKRGKETGAVRREALEGRL